jgi:hypothetical protein
MSDSPHLKTQMANRIAAAGDRVWTPMDFHGLGSRDAIDKVLQRMAAAGAIRRIDRGLYDSTRINPLTGKPTTADYRHVIDAVARRDQTRMMVDGMTAANDLGLSDAVPGQIVVHTDARLRPIRLGKQIIHFRPTAPSKLFWAGRPAMRVVQALHWLRNSLTHAEDRPRLLKRLAAILADGDQGRAIAADLADGLPALPAWMQDVVRQILADAGDRHAAAADDDHHRDRHVSGRRAGRVAVHNDDRRASGSAHRTARRKSHRPEASA